MTFCFEGGSTMVYVPRACRTATCSSIGASNSDTSMSPTASVLEKKSDENWKVLVVGCTLELCVTTDIVIWYIVGHCWKNQFNKLYQRLYSIDEPWSQTWLVVHWSSRFPSLCLQVLELSMIWSFFLQVFLLRIVEMIVSFLWSCFDDIHWRT